MNLHHNLNYYYMEKLLDHLLEQETITRQERKRAAKFLVDICQPDPEFFR